MEIYNTQIQFFRLFYCELTAIAVIWQTTILTTVVDHSCSCRYEFSVVLDQNTTIESINLQQVGMLVAKDLTGYFKTLMNRSLPLKVVVWSLVFSFTACILLLTIISTYFNCSIFVTRTCAESLPYNDKECYLTNEDYCCGAEGILICSPTSNCVVKPTPLNTPVCMWLLLPAWIFQALSVLLLITFVVLMRKVTNRQTATHLNSRRSMMMMENESEYNSGIQIYSSERQRIINFQL